MVRGLIGSTLGLMGSRLVQPFFSFLLFFVSARILSLGEFGLYVLLMGLIVLFQSLSNLGLGQLLAREIGRAPEQECQTIGSVLLLSFPAAVVSFFLFIGLAWLLKGSGDFIYLAAIVALSLPFSNLMQFGESVFVAHAGGVSLLHINIIEQAFRVAISIAALLMGFGLYGLVASYSLGRFLAAMVLVIIFYRRKFCPAPKLERGNLRFVWERMWTFAPMHILANIYFRADIIVLGWLATDEVLGLYGCAMRIVSMSFMLPECIIFSTFPHVSHSWAVQDKNFGSRVVENMNLLLALSFLGTAAMIIGSAIFLTTIFGLKYEDSVPLVAILAFMLPGHALNTQIGLLFQATTKEKLALAGVALATVVFFTFIYFGAIWGGATGAALGTTAATWIMALLYLKFSQPKLYQLPFDSAPVKGVISLAVVLALIAWWRPADDIIFCLAMAVAAIVPLLFGGLWRALSPGRIKQVLSF